MSIYDWSGTIKITFDKPIVSNPDIATGLEDYIPIPLEDGIICSSESALHNKRFAFDGQSAIDWWEGSSTSMPQWIGRDYSVPVEVDKVSVYLNSYMPKDYKIQGSADGSVWQDVVSGTFLNSVGWQDTVFTPTSYRYWRLYLISVHATYHRVYEVKFYRNNAEVLVNDGYAVSYFSSGTQSAQYPINAFDGSASSYWQSSATTSPQWIGSGYGRPITCRKVDVRMDLSNGRINAYEIQGSDDATTWSTVASGNFTNASGVQSVSFSPATYRYWRLYATSKFSTYYVVHELTFYAARDVYNVAGWSVTGYEYDRQPGGSLVQKTYTVRRVTKSEDGLSIFLWLSLAGRMLDPEGLVTIQYAKALGNLVGAVSSQVEDFSIAFTPTNITPVFNPNAVENLQASLTANTNVIEIEYLYGYSTDNIEATLTASTAVIHINDLEQ